MNAKHFAIIIAASIAVVVVLSIILHLIKGVDFAAAFIFSLLTIVVGFCAAAAPRAQKWLKVKFVHYQDAGRGNIQWVGFRGLLYGAGMLVFGAMFSIPIRLSKGDHALGIADLHTILVTGLATVTIGFFISGIQEWAEKRKREE